jgi:hypothetical protein
MAAWALVVPMSTPAVTFSAFFQSTDADVQLVSGQFQ